MAWQITLDLLFRPGYDWPMACLNPLLSAQGSNIHTQANGSRKKRSGGGRVQKKKTAVAAKLARRQRESRL